MPWAWIRQGLEAIARKTGAPWSPVDVYLALQNKTAFLYMLGPDAFVVVQRLVDVEGPYLFVWALYGPHVLRESRHQVMKQLRALAVQCSCRRMEMASTRGWDGTNLGWKVKHTVFVADVWPEDD